MRQFDYFMLIICLIVIIMSGIAVIIDRRKTREILNNIDRMINSAKNGTFIEGDFNETLKSSVETNFADYLWSCLVSEKNLQGEKEKIKELISHISHQTKTPITNILLYSQLLQEENLTEKGRECVNQLVFQSSNLSFLISTLVKVSRLETGIFKVIPTSSSVDNLIDKVVEKAGPTLSEKHINLTVNRSGISALFDLKWTEEAIYNIIDNSIKYTPNNGTITVSSYKYDMFSKIDISDNGIGIKESEHSKIFQRFYRSQDVTSYEGTGIGLYLSREIVTRENGYIKVDSIKGKGSTFSVYLPLS